MPGDTEALYGLFKRQYEKLAGRVYLAASPDEAGRTVKEICLRSKAKRVVAALVPDNLGEAIAGAFNGKEFTNISNHASAEEAVARTNEADLGVSFADFGIAETGTFVEITTEDCHRLVSSLPRVHIALLDMRKIIRSLDDAAPLLRQAYQAHQQNCNITFISGPSRTADIEMKLFLGVHGPQESHVVVSDWT